MLEIKATFRIEKLENGFVVRHVEANRSRHVAYQFGIGSEVERMMHDEAVARREDAAVLEAEVKADVSCGAMQVVES